MQLPGQQPRPAIRWAPPPRIALARAALIALALGAAALPAPAQPPRDPSGRVLDGFQAPSPPLALPKTAASFLAPTLVSELATPDCEAYPSISADGLRMVLGACRPGGLGHSDLYSVSRPTSTSAWGALVHLGSGVNSARYDSQPCTTADGLEIFFVRTDQVFDPWSVTDIYSSFRGSPSQVFDPAVPVAEINSSLADAYPFITPDGLRLYFTSNRVGSQGNDIWFADRPDRHTPFGPAQRFAPANSSGDEISFSIRADGLAAYFCRAPLFGLDTEVHEIIRPTLLDPFGAPTLVPALASPVFDFAPWATADGRQILFTSQNRPGGPGDADIWVSAAAAALLPPSVNLGASPGLEGSPVQRIYGDEIGDNLGGSNNGAAYGDFNGDGLHDLAIGATGIGSLNGGAFIIFGSGAAPTSTINLNTPPGSYGETRILGDDVSDMAGQALAACDFDGDGFDDLILGASRADQGAASNAGEIYVIYGSAALADSIVNLGQAPGTNGETRILGRAANDFAGDALACGDVNADGYDDVIIGAPGALAGFGECYIVYGSAAPPSTIDLAAAPASNGVTRIPGPQAGGMGQAAASGDLNGDGFDDVALGSPLGGAAGEGIAFILFGGASLGGRTVSVGLPFGSDPAAHVHGAISAEQATRALAVGDLDRDGLDDLALGAPGASTGAVRVLYGSGIAPNSVIMLGASPGANETLILGDDAGDMIATSLAAGDIDGDGFDDLILGSSSAANGNGATGEGYIIRCDASSRGATIDLAAGDESSRILGDNGGDKFGSSIAAGGDFRLDGYGDCASAAPFGDNPPGGAGTSQEGYVAQVFGKGFAQEAKAREFHVPGAAPKRGFGGRLSPTLRLWASFSGGDDGSGGESLTTATIARSDLGISGLGVLDHDDVADVFWQVETDRVGFAADIHFKYLDAEIVGLLESSLELYSADALNGPWNLVGAQAHDAARNEFVASVPSVGYFAILGQLDPAYVPVDNAIFLGNTLPAQLFVGREYIIGITLRNTGQTPISAPSCKLAVRDQNCLGFPAQMNLDPSAMVLPNQVFTLYVRVSPLPSPGTLIAKLQMLKNDSKWFGAQLDFNVNVIPQPNAVESWLGYN